MRFGPTERVYHWVQAAPYIVLLLSGGVLLLQRQWGREIVAAETLILVHKICGCLLPAGILLTLLGGDTRTLLRNAAITVRWRGADLRWLLLTPLALLTSRIPAPPSEKFNAGQKLHMLVLFVLISALSCSGLLIWIEPGALLSWYVHVVSFLVAVPFLLGHLDLALVNPGTCASLSGMFSGRVDADWARGHHDLELGVEEEEA